MNYQIGDVIVHWTHGVGKIVAIEAKEIAGSIREYYVVEIKQLKVWVPIAHDSADSIHFPIGRVDFCALLDILKTPANGLPDDQYKRRLDLNLRMKQQTLEDICRVIRDLTGLSRQHTLNMNDSSVLFRAEEHLLDEWEISMGVERDNAKLSMRTLLQREPA